MITCPSCGLSSTEDIGGKCPICWADIKKQASYKKTLKKSEDGEEQLITACMLDSVETEAEGIADSQGDFKYMVLNIQVEHFYEIFNKKSTIHLKPYEYLQGCGKELLTILSDSGKESFLCICAYKPFLKKLLADNCLTSYKFENENEEAEYKKNALLSSFLLSDLRVMCKENGLKTSLKKSQLADQLIASSVRIDLPEAVVVNENFFKMMDTFADMYINNVKANIEKLHPSYISQVWQTIVNDKHECDFIQQKAKVMLDTKYWEKE